MTRRQAGRMALAVLVPVVSWSMLVAVSPRIQPWMGPFGAELLFVGVIATGFVIARGAFPNRTVLLALIYFPAMISLLFLIGVELAWRLYREAL